MNIMKRLLLISIGIILLLVTACDDDDKGVKLSGTPIRLSGKISGMDNASTETRFRGGAGVGVYIADRIAEQSGDLTGARVRNGKFMQSADGLVGDPLVYWERATRIDVAAYYPYARGGEDTPEAYLFQVAERQDSMLDGLSRYDESDFLWARKSADYQEEHIALSFQHLMSKVIINLKSDAMIPGDMVGSEVNILGMLTSASIDLNTGVVAAVGQPGRVVAIQDDVVKSGFEVAMKVILVPQTVEKGITWLEIKTLGGYSYFYELPESFTFQSSKQVTLDVSIESGECHVTVGEIEDWTETGNPVLGEAVEDLPVFELYDFYNLNGVQGIVIALDETGKHGTLVSLDETIEQWCTDPSLMAQAYSDDPMENLEEVLKCDPTLEYFPAMKWCMDKNKDGISGWYMPALPELKNFWNLLNTDSELINGKILATGVPGAVAIETDPFETDGYFSSTLSFSDNVRTMNFSWFGGISTVLMEQTDYCSVRAFYKF
jgi:lipoprotein